MVCFVCMLALIFLSASPYQMALADDGAGEVFETPEGFFGIKFLHDDVDVVPEMEVETCYASTIDPSDWKITDNKDLRIELRVRSCPANTSLWIEHMHADVFLESTLSEWDGIMQDTMDDSYHSSLSYGFFVNESFPYTEMFSIEGYSQWLTQYWAFYYSHGSSSERMTESVLKEHKVYGCSFRIIYDVLFRIEGWPAERTPKFTVDDNFMLYLNGSWFGNEGDVADKPAKTDWFLPGTGLALATLTVTTVFVRKKRRSIDR